MISKMNRLLILTIALLLGSISLSAQVFNENVYKLSKVLDLVDRFYVDTINQTEMVESVIVDMLSELDPHSIYISKDDVKAMNEPLQGSFEGIGIQFNILKDTIIVVSPISGGPSEKVGIRAGDRIVKIEDENVAGVGFTTTNVREKLLGKKGTKVNVSIKRRGVSELIDFEIVRDKIPVYSVDASYMIDDETGYIKINRFSATTMKEYHKAMEELQAQNVKSLIIDLSNNGGGYLNTAIDLADEFLENGKMIVYTEGINSPKIEYKATSRGDFKKGNLIFLIDEGSASASEIVSGAIQDWDRGVIIGRRSFGKGLVQRPFNLPDGSMMRLTVSRYYTPTGRLIQKPYEDGTDEYHRDLINRYNNGELAHADSIHFPDSLKFSTLENERIVYGGGGIMPDIFVSIDTSNYSDYYRDLIRKGILNRFLLDYSDNNRSELSSNYPDFETFDKKFEITEDLFEELLVNAEKEKLERKNEQIEKSKQHIKLQMKALIARNLFTVNEFFRVINRDDNAIQKALEILEDEKLYQSKLTKKVAIK
jgi:carboxyl-terminal processing protease